MKKKLILIGFGKLEQIYAPQLVRRDQLKTVQD